MSKTIAIMQPYFFPYIGYFQLMNAVDEFVVYDNIEYTKKGWINRNRIISNGKDEYITLPLKKSSDYGFISDKSLADTWPKDRKKLLNKIKETYRHAPYFDSVYKLVEDILQKEEYNLFYFLLDSLKKIADYLGIESDIIISSTIDIDHKLKAEEKVIAICNALVAQSYINAIGGVEIYKKANFLNCNVRLEFLKPAVFEYQQFETEFKPWLSIIDVLMFNAVTTIKEQLNHYSLI